MACMTKRARVVVVVAVGLAGALGFLVARRQGERELSRQSHTVAEAIRRVSKLATVEMNLSNWQLRRDAKQLFGFLPFSCEKTIAVFYRGKVAAGFELAPTNAAGLTVNVEQASRMVRVQLPPARILYTDVPPPELVVADGSICNKLTADDYARLHGDARVQIEREAVSAGVLRRAEQHARDLLTEVVRPLGYQVELRIGAHQVAAPPPR